MHNSNKCMLTAAVLWLGGCSSLPVLEEKARYHQIAANTNGNFLSLFHPDNKSGDVPHQQCGLNQHLEILKQKVEAYLNDPNKKKERQILISIHGGLNSIEDNIKRAEQHYETATNEHYYPIFIGWRSGALTTLNDRYFRVRNGVDRSRWVTIPSSPFYLASDLLSGIAAIPESAWDQGANFAYTHWNRFKGNYESDILERQEEFSQPHFFYTQKGDEKSLKEQAAYTFRQFIPGVFRIISTPLIEGVADKAWVIMRRRAKTLMYRQSDLTYRGIGPGLGEQLNDNQDLQNVIACEEASPYFEPGKPNGIVAQLMRTLATIKGAKITLVGHSMGAIIANDVVNEFPELHYDKIIHMAAADTIRNFMEKTMPYLAKHSTTQFYNLMLHPVNEDQEQSALGFAPEGSLLVWIDHLLENPETTLDRVAGRWENIKWAAPLLTSYSDTPLNNVHLKLFGLRQTIQYSADSKPVAEPRKHGDFGDHYFWRPAFFWGKPD